VVTRHSSKEGGPFLRSVCGNTGSHHRFGLRGRVAPPLTCGNTFVNADDVGHGGG
jgi:hypothetical protein